MICILCLIYVLVYTICSVLVCLHIYTQIHTHLKRDNEEIIPLSYALVPVHLVLESQLQLRSWWNENFVLSFCLFTFVMGGNCIVSFLEGSPEKLCCSALWLAQEANTNLLPVLQLESVRQCLGWKLQLLPFLLTSSLGKEQACWTSFLPLMWPGIMQQAQLLTALQCIFKSSYLRLKNGGDWFRYMYT